MTSAVLYLQTTSQASLPGFAGYEQDLNSVNNPSVFQHNLRVQIVGLRNHIAMYF